MTANSEVQASTHTRASTPNPTSHLFLTDLCLVFKGMVRDKLIRISPHESDAIIWIAPRRSII